MDNVARTVQQYTARERTVSSSSRPLICCGVLMVLWATRFCSSPPLPSPPKQMDGWKDTGEMDMGKTMDFADCVRACVRACARAKTPLTSYVKL